MLPQDSRIAFSKIIVAAPAQIAAINLVKTQIATQLAQAEVVDDANENIWSTENTLINVYQNERQYLTGQTYTTYTETDVENAAALVAGNYFYPGLSWTPYVPYALGRGLGLNTDGTPPATITPESIYITTLQAAIATVLAITPNNVSNQITGQTCGPGGTGVGGVSLTATTGFSAAVTAANTAANNWASCLSSEVSALTTIITTDTNPARNAAAVIAKANAQTALTAALTWIALLADLNYIQATNLTQIQFNAATASSAAPAPLGLDPTNLTKFNPINIAALNSAISTRSTFTTTRATQLSTYFGNYTQNSSTGVITPSPVGFYYTRALELQLRIGLVGGSLILVNGLTLALNSQDSQIAAINAQVTVYSSLLLCSQFSADATGTYQVNLLNTNPFTVGDSIYIVSDNADEIQATIQSIDGKRMVLTQNVPVRYLASDYARLYKDIS